jgi:hypothetical protein
VFCKHCVALAVIQQPQLAVAPDIGADAEGEVELVFRGILSEQDCGRRWYYESTNSSTAASPSSSRLRGRKSS